MKTFLLNLLRVAAFFSVALWLTACQSGSDPSQSEEVNNETDQEIVDLPLVSVEIKMPFNIEDVDYTFGLTIYRVGHALEAGLNYTMEDRVVVAVWGEEEMLYGSEEGVQSSYIDSGTDCPLTCEGPIEYVVRGWVHPEPRCELEMHITPIGKLSTCTAACAPGVPIPGTTGVAGVVLKPLVVDLATLSKGVTRDEVIGNYHWTATYTLTSFSGPVTVAGCDFDVAIP